MKTAYSFIRWSTARQSRASSDSKRRQLKSAEDWCRDNGYTLSKQVFIGAAESGFRAKHLKVKDGVAIGALARFIDAVKKGDIRSGSTLCIDSVDRFSRQEILDALAPFTALLNLGIGIVFTGSPLKKLLTRELINKEPHWLQWLINDMIRSWMESAEKSRKVKESKKQKLQDIRSGKVVRHNNVPHYFTWNKETQSYEHNHHTNTVKRLVKLFLDGNTLYRIARTLNRESVPTVKIDSSWSGNAIRCILRNRVLVGEFLGAKDFVPPIVDEPTFERVQSLLSQNPCFNKGKPGNLVNVFRGIAFCSNCKHSMNVLSQTINPHSKKPHEDPFRYRYLRCSTQGTGKTCEHTYVMPVRDMEEMFFGDFLLTDPRELVADKTEARESHAAQAKINLEISKIDTQIKRAVALIASNVAVDEIRATLTKLETEKGKRQAELDTVNLRLSQTATTPRHFDDLRKLCFEAKKAIRQSTRKGELFTFTKAELDRDAAVARLIHNLKDNELRRKVRVLLPNVLGKIIVNTKTKVFEVYNHSGHVVYTSPSLDRNAEYEIVRPLPPTA